MKYLVFTCSLCVVDSYDETEAKQGIVPYHTTSVNHMYSNFLVHINCNSHGCMCACFNKVIPTCKARRVHIKQTSLPNFDVLLPWALHSTECSPSKLPVLELVCALPTLWGLITVSLLLDLMNMSHRSLHIQITFTEDYL